MRVLASLLTLLLLAFVLAPSAQAALPLPPVSPPGPTTPPGVVCAPPASGNGVCAGIVGGSECAWYWFGPSHSIVCFSHGSVTTCTNHLWGSGYTCQSPVAPVIAEPDPVCVPPASGNGVCVGLVDGNPCAWYWGGANHGWACVVDGRPEVCSNHLFDVLYPGTAGDYNCLGDPMP